MPEQQKSFEFLDQNLHSEELVDCLSSLDQQINSSNLVALATNLGIFDQSIFNSSKNRKLISNRGIFKNVRKEV